MSYYLYLTKYYVRWIRGNIWLTMWVLKCTSRFLIAMWQDKGRPSLSCGSTADGRIFAKLNLEEDEWKRKNNG